MDDNKAKFEAWFMGEFPNESLVTDQNGNYKYEYAIPAWAAWNASMKHLYVYFLIVESVWPEGFSFHSMSTSLQTVVDDVGNYNIQDDTALIVELNTSSQLTLDEARKTQRATLLNMRKTFKLDGTLISEV